MNFVQQRASHTRNGKYLGEVIFLGRMKEKFYLKIIRKNLMDFLKENFMGIWQKSWKYLLGGENIKF